MASVRALLLCRLFAFLLLATIGLEAMPGAESTLQQSQGSAFSVSTMDVALVSSGRQEGTRPVLLAPTLPPPANGAMLLGRYSLVINDPQCARPDPTGPPRNDVVSLPLAPRPPPAA